MERNQERTRLRIYKIYAFGIPMLIAGIAAMRHSSSTPGDVYLQPHFCETEYWFAGECGAGDGNDTFIAHIFHSCSVNSFSKCLKFKIE